MTMERLTHNFSKTQHPILPFNNPSFVPIYTSIITPPISMRQTTFSSTLCSILLIVVRVSAFSPPLVSFNNKRRTVCGLKMSSNGKIAAPQMDKAKGLISNAISIGAPAYNAGDIKECARVYKSTALDIVSLLPQNLKAALEATINTPHEDDMEEAWAFRRQFDAIIGYIAPFVPEDVDTSYTLEKFTDAMIPSQPFIVNDNVMGGLSRGQWLSQSNSFTGSTSLQNNGGFASLRWRLNTIQNWSYAKGMYLKVKHSNPEQHTFRIILKDTSCEQVRGANFKNVFSNPNQVDEPIMIPFSAFDQMEQMGRQLPGSLFNRGAVTELGLMAIKPSVVGEFELVVEEWGLYF